MLIELETSTISETEAEALISLLWTLFPAAAESAVGRFMIGVSAVEGPTALDTDVRTADEAFSAQAPMDPATAFASAPLADASPDGAPVAPAGAPSIPSAGALGVDLDADGVPWDGRIHAGTKSKTQKGFWKVKKGLPDGEHARVTAELKAVMAATPPGATPDTPAHATAAAVAEAATPPPPPPPAETAHPATDGQSPAAAFASAMRKVTEAQKADKITVVDLNTIIAGLGLAQMRDLLNRPDLIPSFEEQLAAYIASAPAA